MDTKKYEDFYVEYYPYICNLAYHFGIHFQDIPDVSSDIVLSILEQDGLSKFDPDKNVKIKTYIVSYVLMLVKAQKTRVKKYAANNILVDQFPTEPSGQYYNAFEDSELADKIRDSVDGDALTFLEFAETSRDYRLARKNLSDMGWEKRRITAAVTTVRKKSRELIS